MKNRILERLGLGLTLACLPLAVGCLQQAGAQLEATTAAAPGKSQSTAVEVGQTDPAIAAGEQSVEDEVSDAPAKPISTERPLPTNLHPAGALSEMIKLAESGVDEAVMLAYVTNSTATFSLGPEEIIYLNDIGVPAPVVSAMMQHDHLLVTGVVNSARTPVLTGVEPPEPGPSPVPEATPPSEGNIAYDSPTPVPAEPSDASFGDALAPYGTWVEVGGYGRCWQPSVVVVNHDWQPYCDHGHWVYSDCGWYWMSDYSWGWAPFHYGRWFRHDRLGWCWAPDSVWGPSWVSWRYSNTYCGWAPLPPVASFRPGLGFTYRGASVGFSFNFGIPASCYTFVPARNFCDYRVSRFALPSAQVSRIYNQTVAVNKIVGDGNRIVNRGIPADHIAAATHTQIRPVAVRDAGGAPSQGGRGDRLEEGGRALAVFRPHPGQVPRTPSALSGAPGIVNGPAVASTSSDEGRRAAAPAERTTGNHQTFYALYPGSFTPLSPASHASAGSRDAGTERVAPSIARASSRPSQTASAADAANYFTRSGVNQSRRTAAANSASHATSRPLSQWERPRSVEGRPRYEQPDSGYASESSPTRFEVQNQRSAAPNAPSYEARQWQYGGPVRTPQIQPQYNASAPPYSSQPQHSAHETATVHQPHNEVHSAPSVPATSPAAPSHSNSSSNGRGK